MSSNTFHDVLVTFSEFVPHFDLISDTWLSPVLTSSSGRLKHPCKVSSQMITVLESLKPPRAQLYTWTLLLFCFWFCFFVVGGFFVGKGLNARTFREPVYPVKNQLNSKIRLDNTVTVSNFNFYCQCAFLKQYNIYIMVVYFNVLYWLIFFLTLRIAKIHLLLRKMLQCFCSSIHWRCTYTHIKRT